VDFGNWGKYLCASWGMGEGWYQIRDSGGGGRWLGLKTLLMPLPSGITILSDDISAELNERFI
jgi:hypothetical protein